MKDHKRIQRIERAALAITQSVLLIIIAAAIYLVGERTLRPYETLKPKVLPAKSGCDGTKLNYPLDNKEKINGKEVTFRYNCIRQDFTASSYDGNCKGCSGRTHFTNEPVRWGICAVDPTVIPPKSTFYVPGYGPCKAADKGGAVKGRKIDLGFAPTDIKWWSKRRTDIYTLVK
ncbi:MAG: hypothetical protein BMS9Abin34_485 [Patescibacteria group bacterium]|nr:MAG: hypothetical protein BMS9Abin34_485 [Patescibacteria group bacterium]